MNQGFLIIKFCPYKEVEIGDLLYFKQTGKDITAIATISKAKFYECTPEIIENIRINFGKEIGTDKFEDWEETKRKNYCTLIWFKKLEFEKHL